MKTKFLNDLDRKVVPDDGDRAALSETEMQDARLGYLLSQAAKDKQVETLRKQTLRQLEAIEAMRANRPAEDRHASYISMFVEGADGKLTAETVSFGRPTDTIRKLMDERPLLITGLVWRGLSVLERRELLEVKDLAADLAMQPGIMDILPAASLTFLQEWQQQINAGHAWHSSETVAQTALWLIGEGFCLASGESTTDAYGNESVSRYDKPSGKSGTVAFVRAMMGSEYVEWLLVAENTP